MPLGLVHRCQDSVRAFLIVDLYVLAFVLRKLCFEQRRLARVQHRVNRPVLLRDECANLLFTFDDQPQRNGLHAAGGESAAHFIPQ